ncbi:Imm10 family immunity protein [Streptomyces sp. NPDC055078]
MEITARSVGYEEDEVDEVIEAGFSERGDGSGFVLSIQRTAYEPDDQDVSLGMDTYCLSSGGRTHYGGILRAVKEGNSLQLSISSQAALSLDIPEEIKVHLDAPDNTVESFFGGLPGILVWGRMEDRPMLIGFSR